MLNVARNFKKPLFGYLIVGRSEDDCNCGRSANVFVAKNNESAVNLCSVCADDIKPLAPLLAQMIDNLDQGGGEEKEDLVRLELEIELAGLRQETKDLFIRIEEFSAISFRDDIDSVLWKISKTSGDFGSECTGLRAKIKKQRINNEKIRRLMVQSTNYGL